MISNFLFKLLCYRVLIVLWFLLCFHTCVGSLICVRCKLKQGCLFLCILYVLYDDLPVCPTYELLQVLHFSLYIPLELVLDYCITELFVYGVCGMEGYVQVGIFEYISYFAYKWTVICECDSFFFLLVCLCAKCMLCFSN